MRVIAVIAIIAAMPLLAGCPGGSSGSGGGAPDAPRMPDAIPHVETTSMQPRVAEAFTTARRRVETNPGSALAWGEYAEVCDAHELYEPAETAYRGACALAPREFRWAYGLALMVDYNGAPADDVAGAFRRAAALEPEYPPVHFRLGDALARHGRLEDAAGAHRRALELDATLAMASRGLGQALLGLGDAAAAIPHLERAEAAAPDDRATLAALARAVQLTGDAERAASIASRLARSGTTLSLPDPVRAAVLARGVSAEKALGRARAAIAAGDHAGAIPDLVLAAESAPDDASIRMQLGESYLRTGDAGAAFVQLSRAIAIDDQLDEAHVGLGAILFARQDLDGAARHLVRAIEIAPRNGVAHARLGSVHAVAGRFDAALAAFAQADALGAIDAQSARNWGAILQRRGDLDGAIALYRRSVGLNPRYAGGHTSLAEALERKGLRAEAIDHYRIAASIDPDGPAARRLRELGG